jgi:hypothetical protein
LTQVFPPFFPESSPKESLIRETQLTASSIAAATATAATAYTSLPFILMWLAQTASDNL